MKQNVTVGDIDADRPGTVADYIRHNDEAVFMATDKLLNAYQNDFLNCGSFDEFFCDVAGNMFFLLIISIPHCDNYHS
jgi:NADH:ubiquinone oxidoreductase subunit K